MAYAVDPDKIKMGDKYREANSALMGDPAKAFPNTRQAFTTARDEASALGVQGRNPFAAAGRVFQGGAQVIAGLGRDIAGSSRQIAGTVAAAPMTPSAPQPSALAGARPWGGETTSRPAAPAPQNNPAMRGGSAGRLASARGPNFTVSDTSVAGVRRVDQRGQSPLFTNLDPQVALSQMQGGTVNSFDMRAGNESLARANAIRASMMPDGPKFSSIGGGSGGGGVRSADESNALGQRWAMERSMADPTLTRAQRAQITDMYLKPQEYALQDRLGQMKESGAMARTQLEADSRLANTGLEGQYRLQDADRRGQWGLQERDRVGAWSMAQQGLQNAGQYQTAQLGADQRTQASQDRLLATVFKQYQTALTEAPDDAARVQVARQYESLLDSFDPPQERDQTIPKHANGGLVEVPGYAMGGPVQAPQAMPEVTEYRDYAMGARQLGLPAIPFEQFLAMRSQAQAPAAPQQGVPGFANGGEVPMMSAMQMMQGDDPHAAGGKMVMDTDPNAETDSIPAVIDGQHPAKLDSGEFVIPEDVVKFFGTDKLNKMIAAARAGQQPQE